MVKRFAVFGGSNFYPAGGMDDFLKSFDTHEEAKAYAATQLRDPHALPWATRGCDWVEVEDMERFE